MKFQIKNEIPCMKHVPGPVVPLEETRSSKLTSLECSPRRDCTPPLLFGFVPVSKEEFPRVCESGSTLSSMPNTKSFKSKGFGVVDSE